MTLSYADAAAQITAPGERYETHEITVDGVEFTAFKGAPGTLRDRPAKPDWVRRLRSPVTPAATVAVERSRLRITLIHREL